MLPFAAQLIEKKWKVVAALRDALPMDEIDNCYLHLLEVATKVVDFRDDGMALHKKIEALDWGEYHGTLVFVLAQDEYQPSVHYVTHVFYGSCSHCDTMRDILYRETEPYVKAERLFDLTLHMFQRMQRIGT